MRKSVVKRIREKLHQQNYRCALSGVRLTPDSFELDHIISMAEGGTDDPSNLQCVHPKVNRMKRTMGNDEFIRWCNDVSRFMAKTSGSLSEGVPSTLRCRASKKT